MKPWSVELGTFWVLDAANGLPPECSARVEVEFSEFASSDMDSLTAAMNLSNPEPVRQRLQAHRRCFLLKAGGQIAAYGWVTHGRESVGELEREFNLHDDEAYIWDCGTVPAWRGQRCYSALLSQIIHLLHREGVPYIWIGASRLNKPSVQGIANAGFHHILDLTYQRISRLKLIWFREIPNAPPPLISAAYRILLNDNERRWGPWVIGMIR